jgi:hypothetical protein
MDDYLKQDGAFLLRLIAHNTNQITTTEVTCALWDLWKEKREVERPPPQNPEKINLDEPDNHYPEHDRLYPDPLADEIKTPLGDEAGESMA